MRFQKEVRWDFSPNARSGEVGKCGAGGMPLIGWCEATKSGWIKTRVVGHGPWLEMLEVTQKKKNMFKLHTLSLLLLPL